MEKIVTRSKGVTIEDSGASETPSFLSEIVIRYKLVTILGDTRRDWLRGDYDLVTKIVTAVFPSRKGSETLYPCPQPQPQPVVGEPSIPVRGRKRSIRTSRRCRFSNA
jgi:hypothetical protein